MNICINLKVKKKKELKVERHCYRFHYQTKSLVFKTELQLPKVPYLNPADADTALKQLLDGTGEEECDGESHGGVEWHSHKHTTCWDGISQKDVEGEGDKNDDLAGAEEGSHVETS